MNDVVVVALHEESEVLQFVFLAFLVGLIVAEDFLFVLQSNSSGLDEGRLERVPVAVDALL